MNIRWICSLCFIILCLSISECVSAEDIKTFFGLGEGRVVLIVDDQHDRVNVILEPEFGTYNYYDYDESNQIDQRVIQWIIPLPVPATNESDLGFFPSSFEPAFRETLNQLDELTQVSFEPEVPRYCYDTYEYGGRSGNHSFHVEHVAETTNYSVIPNADFDTVLNQFREEEFNISDKNIPRLRQHVESGLSFLAVTYHLDAQEVLPGPGQFTVYGAPLLFSFQQSEEIIPLTFAPLNSTIWIFGDHAYRSANVPHAFPDYSQFYAPHSIANTGNFVYYDHNNLFSVLTNQQYQAEMQHLLTSGNIVTEYAGSTDILAEVDFSSWDITDTPYVSRLIVRMSDTIPYLQLEPEYEESDISNIVNLNEYVDPLEYWGCSSRTALDDVIRTNLPNGRQRFDDLRFAVAFPLNWQLSTLTNDEGTIYGFSPVKLTREAIAAALNGDLNQPPMFVFSEHTYITEGYGAPPLMETNLLTQLNIERNSWPENFVIRFDMRQKEWQQEHGVMYGITANEADWEENEAVYIAMLAYARSYQYFASAEWPHTLFVQSHSKAETVVTLEIPYPEGWIEHVDGDDIVISNDAAELRLVPLTQITSNLLQQRYNLIGDLSREQPAPFSAHGREGYVFPTTGYLVEVSTPAGEIAEYESVLLNMIAALPDTCIKSQTQ